MGFAFCAPGRVVIVTSVARVIWQESRFNARAVSPKGCFGHRTVHAADRRLAATPIRSIRLRRCAIRRPICENCETGLAISGSLRQPTMQVQAESAWLASHRPLPGETRNYVAIITGWTADEWASGSPPQVADTTIPQGVPCIRLANLILAPKEEAKRSRLTYRAGDMACSPFGGEQGVGDAS